EKPTPPNKDECLLNHGFPLVAAPLVLGVLATTLYRDGQGSSTRSFVRGPGLKMGRVSLRGQNELVILQPPHFGIETRGGRGGCAIMEATHGTPAEVRSMHTIHVLYVCCGIPERENERETAARMVWFIEPCLGDLLCKWSAISLSKYSPQLRVSRPTHPGPLYRRGREPTRAYSWLFNSLKSDPYPSSERKSLVSRLLTADSLPPTNQRSLAPALRRVFLALLTVGDWLVRLSHAVRRWSTHKKSMPPQLPPCRNTHQPAQAPARAEAAEKGLDPRL
ncbi:hypothetical protein BKA56DRAFT_708325, partial [Ilyonectria sp. MPI-CAGE-AT-0026]